MNFSNFLMFFYFTRSSRVFADPNGDKYKIKYLIMYGA